VTAWHESDEERAFVRAIADNPDDETTRLVYADWLDERGDPRGSILRLEAAAVKLHADHPGFASAQAELEGAWHRVEAAVPEAVAWYRDVIAARKARVEICGRNDRRPLAVAFTYRCPNRWESLRPTSNDHTRYCPGCGEIVFFCQTRAEVWNRAKAGQCAAVSSKVAAEIDEGQRLILDDTLIGVEPALGSGHTMGRVRPVYEPEADDLQPERPVRRKWWKFW
jgi:uncharacterized protein (TIGR02996 family)